MSEELTRAESRALAPDELPKDGSLPSILMWALQNNVPADTIEHLMKLDQQKKAEIAKAEFARAMSAAQREMQPVVRDAENPHTKSRYARLETIDAAIRPIYTKHGFSLSFNNPKSESDITVTCKVRHDPRLEPDMTHTEEYELSAPPDTTGAKGAATKTNVQGLGSTISYLRRYLTCMIFNIVLKNEDKDGNITGFVTEQQANNIIDAIKRAELTPEREAKFLETMQAESVSEIRQQQYARAMNLLEQARRKAIKPLDFEEFPDPLDFQPGVRICVAGSIYERSPEGTTWRPVAMPRKKE